MRTYPTLLLWLSVLLCICSCRNEPLYEQAGNSVIVHLQNSQTRHVRLSIIRDNIIRVTASSTDSFSHKPSLITSLSNVEAIPLNIKEGDQKIIVSTLEIEATVNLKTGEVIFADEQGTPLLREKTGGGKKFIPIAQEGHFKVSQSFESDDDDAYYGLGSHQNRLVNYKGKDVDLVQHNMVAVVPFILSSKGYGLLWDNYSISKFGDPRDYQSLSSLNGEGLTATYYVGPRVLKTAVEKEINYEYLETPQVDSFPNEVSRNGKVVWEGVISSTKAGDHKFCVYGSGYIKLWIDNKLQIDKWRQNWNPWTTFFTVPLTHKARRKIKIEWVPDGGKFFSLKHLDPLPSEEQNRLTLSSDVAQNIDYYFIRGKNADDVIRGYRTLTGKAPIVPKWALGFWQSRERYRSQEELLNVLKEYRALKLPIDNIVLDWQYWEDPKWGSHEFDANRFPDPKAMVAQIHKDHNAHLMISVWPKFNKGTSHYEEMKAHGFLFTRNIDKKRKDWVGVGYESTFYDPFNSDARQLFWDQINSHLNIIGVDAWWLDATEPDIHSNLSIEERIKNMSATALGPGEEYFNAYSLMNAKAVYEGQRRESPDKRVFILTRSAYAGQQRYGASTWTGDIAATWSDFEDQISAGINFSLSGLPYWTTDIGGFATESRYNNPTEENLREWRELNTRWFQFAAFCPLFRSHGQYPYREIYNIAPSGHSAFKSMEYYLKLRYRLLPYLYTLAADCYWDDYTMMRGLVMDFGEDPCALNVADQFMLGPALLVNPVYRYKANSRPVYLPATDGWYNFYSGEFLKGGQTITASAPYEQIPIYVKAGSILPFGPEIAYAAEKAADPVTLYVFAGKDATFSLYEDENTNYNYEKGAWMRIPLKYEEESATLTIGAREGSFKDILKERTFQIIWVKTDHSEGGSYFTRPPQVITYSGEEQIITLK